VTLRPDALIYVAGHRGMVGRALVRALEARGHTNLLLPARAELDLRDGSATRSFFAAARPEYVFLAAAKVGGILANSEQPASFLADNLAIALNVVDAAWRSGVRKLVNLGSSCIYPRLAPQPIPEDALLTGPLEPTNEPYAVAKIAAIKLCDSYRRQYGCNFVSLMPTNLYGPHDNFDLHTSHVLPALIRKCDDARESGADAVTVWGSGTPRREFLHVDDLADACLFVMDRWDGPGFINVGTGRDITVAEAAQTVADVVGFGGRLDFDRTRPDGAPRKLLDVSRLRALGWEARIELRKGLANVYGWYRSHLKEAVNAEAH
jgi:GDP-L-fucose synthase